MNLIKNTILPVALYTALSINQTLHAQPLQRETDIKNESHFNTLLFEYQKKSKELPLNAIFIKEEKLQGVRVRHYRLTFQIPKSEQNFKEDKWLHDVIFYIPDKPYLERSLLIINNGINNPSSGQSVAKPTDFTVDMLVKLANQTHTIVTSISDIPNQYLIDEKDDKPRKEDDSIAHSWHLFMNDTAKNVPLQLPMTAAVSQAMSLAERVLKEWDIKTFIVTGLSKRGWTAWLTAISDPRVDAVVPFVIDLLNQRKALTHMYNVYGGNWPIAFAPYYNENIDTQINTSQFSKLMQVQDPLAYANGQYKERLSIPKYIINASGDDFYAPDNAQFYYDKLPGERSLRVIPNSNHYGVKAFAVQTLTYFINRIQQNAKLPDIRVTVEKHSNAETLTLHFSERPVRLSLWSANNPHSRDFRFACNIRYQQSALPLPVNNAMQLNLVYPPQGWSAAFIEATFSDGYVATTPIFISKDDTYPDKAPEKIGSACQTLPGRGLGLATE
ncbi:PhoPQ-regulated protein [Rouxiella silvae]|uniref:PhoPQ-regulated protein n=1 Tax=Rouxiella silvae TaxID=1646373 RepID=A0AA40X517_9GAMM|nr:PhoPQ-activated protein PqaA family protein [Rouxiella silvae]MBF6638479.1 PhoPQ-regulated protein [Rouxiella silvae]